MKGVVLNVVQEVVELQFGADVWDDAVERTGVDGAYTSLGNYPESDLDRLAEELSTAVGVSKAEMYTEIGRHGFRHLAERHPDLLVLFTSWRDVVEHLDGIIHVEVRKIYPGVAPPSFVVRTDDDGSLVLTYHSERRLCCLAEGLLLGLGDWYRSPLVVSHVECHQQGAALCTLVVREEQ